MKILSSLDDREYGLIIGLPTIKKYNLTHIFNGQFNDIKLGKLAMPSSKESDVISKKIEPKLRIPLRNNIISNSLSDNSANFSNDFKLECVGSGLITKVTSVSSHT